MFSFLSKSCRESFDDVPTRPQSSKQSVAKMTCELANDCFSFWVSIDFLSRSESVGLMCELAQEMMVIGLCNFWSDSQ